MARRSSQAKISLFPFLAVLVCTMGALILLLLVTTRRMNQNQAAAAAVADQTTSDATDAFSQPLTEDAFVVSLEETRRHSAITKNSTAPRTQLSIALLPPAPITAAVQAKKREQIEQLQAQLDSEQNRHAELLAEMQTIKERLQHQTTDTSQYVLQMQELSQLKTQHAQLDQQLQSRQLELGELHEQLDRDSVSVEDAESLLKARESALLNLRKLVQDIPEEGVAGTDQTIVEFTNSTGTHRSPIILDVSAAGFGFLPSQVRITQQDMEGFPGNDNPLLAGVLAIHEHRHAQSATVKPYILLLVRPDGSMPFYAAQRTLNDAGIHFGYELLEQDRKIAAGPSPQPEVAALRQAILAAFNRRETLYRGLMAEVDQLKESLAARKAAQVGERTVQMTPDGRFLMPDEQGSNSEALFAAQNEGRFYAGGQAPPPGSLTRRNGLPETNALPETASRDSGAQPETTDRTSPLASEFAEMLAEAGGAKDFTQESFAPDSRDVFPAPRTPGLETANLLPGDGSTFAKSETSDRENPEALSEFSAAEMPTEPASEADANQLRNSLRMSPDLYGNLGVPAYRSDSKTIAGAPAMGSVHPPSQSTASPTDDPREPTGWSDSGTAPANLTPRTASPAQALSAAEQTMSANVVLNSQSSGKGSGSANGSGSAPSTDSESFLQKFMQRVEEVKGQRAPDPMLVQLLKRGWEQSADSSDSLSDSSQGDVHNHPDHSNRPTAFARFPDDTRFPSATASPSTASAAAARPVVSEPTQTQQVYYVIRIFVEPEQLTIGDYEAVSTVDWDADQRLAMTLEVVSATMDEVWSSVRKDALPAVRFLVAPGAEAFQATLGQQLAGVQIPTRGVLKLSAEMTADRFFSDVPLPGHTSTSQSASGSESAKPAADGSGQVSKGSL